MSQAVMEHRLVPVQAWGREAYHQPPFTGPQVLKTFRQALLAFVGVLPASERSRVWCADDSIAWFKTLGFLADPDLVAAHEPYADLPYLGDKLWRTYTSCWAARSCLGLPGAFVDAGCYDGVATDIRYRYCGSLADAKAWYLYDTFDYAASGHPKPNHGPQLLPFVRSLFTDRTNVSIVPGLLPASLATGPSAIACLFLDLNDAESERRVLAALYDAIVPGGMVVLDDYGDSAYAESQAVEQAFFADRGQLVYECPTGQGLVVKR